MRRATVRLPGALMVLGTLIATGSGCSSAELSPPTGVDELTIPTASPSPRDFVTGVDNPWFPLAPGSTRIYRLEGGEGTSRTRTVTVAADLVPVQGVATTVVRTVDTTAQDRVVAESTASYAQDTDGNVWLFARTGTAQTRTARTETEQTGEDETWQAGRDDAEAGLVMAARPRVGDGYRIALQPGVVEDRAEVLSISTNRLEIEETSALTPGFVVRSSYDRGVGLVDREAVVGSGPRAELTGVTP